MQRFEFNSNFSQVYDRKTRQIYFSDEKKIESGVNGKVIKFSNAEKTQHLAVKTSLYRLPREKIATKIQAARQECVIWNKAYQGTGLDIAECYSTQEGYFLVLPFIDGQTIDDACSQENNKIEGIKICLAAAKAMKALHSKEISHGDINPGNFLIQKYFNGYVALIVDFGMAVESTKKIKSDIEEFSETILSRYAFLSKKYNSLDLIISDLEQSLRELVQIHSQSAIFFAHKNEQQKSQPKIRCPISCVIL